MEKVEFTGKGKEDPTGDPQSSSQDHDQGPLPHCTLSGEQQQAVREQLERLLASPAFRSSPRSKEFLAHIVERALEGDDDALKERSIGAEVFHRRPDYVTGDDPVVRVTAREVRRRLTRYYTEEEAGSNELRIDLPVGSYRPEFRWRAVRQPGAPEPPAQAPASAPVARFAPQRLTRRWVWGVAAIVLLLSGLVWLRRQTVTPQQPSDQFWAPILASAQPVLVCLDSPVVYQPSMRLYQRYSGPDAGRYATETQRIRIPLQLPPTTPLQWQDMAAAPDFYVANGDAYAAARFSVLFAGLQKSSELHIGSGCSYQDMRYSPAVLVGAFNNEWTLRLTSSLPFRFAETHNQGRIETAGSPSQRWSQHWDKQGRLDRDYGVVSRLFDSETGQMVIIVAGIGPEGTQAVSDLVTSSKALSRALQTAPSGWANEDLQLVFSTPIVDGVPGTPSLVAAKFWPVH